MGSCDELRAWMRTKPWASCAHTPTIERYRFLEGQHREFTSSLIAKKKIRRKCLKTTTFWKTIIGDFDLDAVIESEIISLDSSAAKLFGKDVKYKVLAQNTGQSDDNLVVISQTPVEGSPTTTPRLIDKDDPRSRLHFVKYLKREGKTVKIWECGICTKEFRHQYTLMRHLPTHTDERNFKCEACGKAFRQLSTLSQHKAIHSDARPYVCEFCKKTFNRVSTLISHRKTHSEHKPHKCHICGKGFHQKGNLRNHVFTHTNERPYKCELCAKGFNQMSNLVCHKVKAHAYVEKMQYVCEICEKEFPRRFSLRAHEEQKHGIKYRNSSSASESSSSTDSVKCKSDETCGLVDELENDGNSIGDVKEKETINSSSFVDNIMVDKINSKAMETAILEGQTPFALFKPAKGIPVLVRISPAQNSKHILSHATAEDLKMNENVIVNQEDVKSLQVKVPVVATITQKMDSSGKFSYLVDSSSTDEEQENLITPLDSQFYPEKRSDHSDQSSPEDCNELLELAAQGGIQFVRATEDGRYEVMTNSEARELMSQNSHDVTILDGEEAEAINIVNLRQNETGVNVANDNNVNDQQDTMVIDSMKPEENKEISANNIEILGDKEIRILDNRELDDRYEDGISFLPSTKIDDLILDTKFDENLPVDCDDHGMGIGTDRPDYTNLLNHRQDISTITTSSHSSISSILTKSYHPSIPNENTQFLKNCDEFDIINMSPTETHHLIQDYSKLQVPGYDDYDSVANLSTIQPDFSFLGSRYSNMRQNNNQTFYSSFGDMKILGSKNSPSEMIMQYQDMKLFNNFGNYLDSHEDKMDLKLLGKKIETGIFTNLDNGLRKSISDVQAPSRFG
ncbi:RE1-silencing transcription factor A-like [Leptopilina heterotoma]|uniref:RE1-silencing transcription factor A-like n=1 Tax=Leptopilina heterotoma TaxID=63436 RepID=UPI001CA938AE|nr:RE1-silencing transcription factor A-like [Leptopilina heterotoma]